LEEYRALLEEYGALLEEYWDNIGFVWSKMRKSGIWTER